MKRVKSTVITFGCQKLPRGARRSEIAAILRLASPSRVVNAYRPLEICTNPRSYPLGTGSILSFKLVAKLRRATWRYKV
jgi:hypothetical protein